MNRLRFFATQLWLDVTWVFESIANGTYYPPVSTVDDHRTYELPVHQDPAFWE